MTAIELRRSLFGDRLLVNTEHAARALCRRPGTLRKWACFDSGPIRPVRDCGKILWRVSDLMKLAEEAS